MNFSTEQLAIINAPVDEKTVDINTPKEYEEIVL